ELAEVVNFSFKRHVHRERHPAHGLELRRHRSLWPQHGFVEINPASFTGPACSTGFLVIGLPLHILFSGILDGHWGCRRRRERCVGRRVKQTINAVRPWLRSEKKACHRNLWGEGINGCGGCGAGCDWRALLPCPVDFAEHFCTSLIPRYLVIVCLG